MEKTKIKKYYDYPERYTEAFYGTFPEVDHKHPSSNPITKSEMGTNRVYVITRYGNGTEKREKNSVVISKKYLESFTKNPRCVFLQWNDDIIIDNMNELHAQLELPF